MWGDRNHCKLHYNTQIVRHRHAQQSFAAIGRIIDHPIAHRVWDTYDGHSINSRTDVLIQRH